LAAVGCSPAPPDEADYLARIEAERADKDRFFGDPRNEPNIAAAQRETYLPLAYYPVDVAYHAPAELKLAETREVAQIPTSTGPLRTMERIGTLEFTVNGQQLALTAFREPGSSSLFVPFRDETSVSETYPGGRYLDLAPTRTGLYEVDFNRAYHPYCYFNTSYECPIPPRENRLPVAIRAGEKLSEAKRAELESLG
jgi:hypothetical protein